MTNCGSRASVVAVHYVAARTSSNSDTRPTAMGIATDQLNRNCPYYFTENLTFKYFAESMPLGRELQKYKNLNADC